MKFHRYISFCIFVLSFLLFTSCSPRLKPSETKQAIVFPLPPDNPKIQYLTSISTSADIVKKQSAFEKSVVGEKQVLPILKPYGMYVKNGKLYVCDVSLGGALEVIDFEAKSFEYFAPKGEAQLKLPLSCFVDNNDNLYVADITFHKINVYDANRKYVTTFGKKENVKPTDVFVKGNKIWVVDSGNNRVNVYDKKTYKFKFYFPKLEKGDEGFLYKPTSIFVSKDKIYVSDMGNGNVKTYDHKGVFLASIGKYGKNIGEFVRPKGISVDKESNLYVVDASFENVQIFNKEGKLLMFFGGHYKGEGDMWLPTKIMVDYDNLKYFKKYVDKKFDLKYLIFVANQYGPSKISVYGRIELLKN